MTESALQTETQHETTTFEHFDRTWTVPTKRHLSHLVKMRDAMALGVGSYDLMVAETFLSADEWAELLKIDPDEKGLDAFSGKVAEALGLKTSGNS